MTYDSRKAYMRPRSATAPGSASGALPVGRYSMRAGTRPRPQLGGPARVAGLLHQPGEQPQRGRLEPGVVRDAGGVPGQVLLQQVDRLRRVPSQGELLGAVGPGLRAHSHAGRAIGGVAEVPQPLLARPAMLTQPAEDAGEPL